MSDREELINSLTNDPAFSGWIRSEGIGKAAEIAVDTILSAGFHRQEAQKTTVSFEEWRDDKFFTNESPRTLDGARMGWNAALEHSADLTAARQRIEELETALKKIADGDSRISGHPWTARKALPGYAFSTENETAPRETT